MYHGTKCKRLMVILLGPLALAGISAEPFAVPESCGDACSVSLLCAEIISALRVLRAAACAACSTVRLTCRLFEV